VGEVCLNERSRRSRSPVLALLAALAGCEAIGHAPDPAAIVRGPFPARTQQPLALTVLALPPRKAENQRPGEGRLAVTSAYTNIQEISKDADSATDKVVMDGELWRTAVNVRFGVTECSDVEVELPVVYTTSGFMDGAIESFHEALGLPNGGRDLQPQDQFTMDVRRDGAEAWSMDEDRVGFGDLPIVYSMNIVRESVHGFGLAWRAGVELPTGDEDAGFGNGTFDAGLGLSAESSLGRWTLFGGGGYVFAGTPDDLDDAGIELANVADLELGVEYRWADSVSLLLQTVLTSPITTDVELDEIDQPILDLALGAMFDVGARSRLALGFQEDVIAKAGPDFGLFLWWRRSF
jgi:hypothetical protein